MLLPPTTKGYSGLYTCKHPEKYKGDHTNITWRSTWEKHVMDTLDSNPNVIEWSSESVVIPYVHPVDGRVHRYFPDMWAKVKRRDGSVMELLIEVKPYNQTMPPKQGKRKTRKFMIEAATYATNMSKWASAREYCKDRGWEFVVMTEKSIFK